MLTIDTAKRTQRINQVMQLKRFTISTMFTMKHKESVQYL